MVCVFVLTRLFLHTFPSTNLEVGPYNIHHLFVGIVLVVVAGLAMILRTPRGMTRWILAAMYGAGLALVLDEWVYLIVTEGSDAEYLLPKSLIGAVILIVGSAIFVIVLAHRKS